MLNHKKRGFEKKNMIKLVFALVLLVVILNLFFVFGSFSKGQNPPIQKNTTKNQTVESSGDKLVLNSVPLSQPIQNQTTNKTSTVKKKHSGGGGGGGGSSSSSQTQDQPPSGNTDNTGNTGQNNNQTSGNNNNTNGTGQDMTFDVSINW